MQFYPGGHANELPPECYTRGFQDPVDPQTISAVGQRPVPVSHSCLPGESDHHGQCSRLVRVHAPPPLPIPLMSDVETDWPTAVPHRAMTELAQSPESPEESDHHDQKNYRGAPHAPRRAPAPRSLRASLPWHCKAPGSYQYLLRRIAERAMPAGPIFHWESAASHSIS